MVFLSTIAAAACSGGERILFDFNLFEALIRLHLLQTMLVGGLIFFVLLAIFGGFHSQGVKLLLMLDW